MTLFKILIWRTEPNNCLFISLCARLLWFSDMDDINLHYRFLNWRRRIREIRDGRRMRHRERFRRMLRVGDCLRYQWWDEIVLRPFKISNIADACPSVYALNFQFQPLFFPFRYHGHSDEVGCFVASRPLTRRNRYYEVEITMCVFFFSVTINIECTDLCRTQNSGLTRY